MLAKVIVVVACFVSVAQQRHLWCFCCMWLTSLTERSCSHALPLVERRSAPWQFAFVSSLVNPALFSRWMVKWRIRRGESLGRKWPRKWRLSWGPSGATKARGRSWICLQPMWTSCVGVRWAPISLSSSSHCAWKLNRDVPKPLRGGLRWRALLRHQLVRVLLLVIASLPPLQCGPTLSTARDVFRHIIFKKKSWLWSAPTSICLSLVRMELRQRKLLS